MCSIHIYSRYDCDEFTKAFYHHNFGITNFTPVTVEAPKAQALEKVCLCTFNNGMHVIMLVRFYHLTMGLDRWKILNSLVCH